MPFWWWLLIMLRSATQDIRSEDDTMSVGTALGQECEAPNSAGRSLSQDGGPHTGYASSQSSDAGLKGRPGSPDSPLLWAGGLYAPCLYLLMHCHRSPW